MPGAQFGQMPGSQMGAAGTPATQEKRDRGGEVLGPPFGSGAIGCETREIMTTIHFSMLFQRKFMDFDAKIAEAPWSEAEWCCSS